MKTRSHAFDYPEAHRRRPRNAFTTTGAIMFALSLVLACGACRDTGTNPLPPQPPAGHGTMSVVIDDTLCSVITGSWSVAQLTSGANAAFSVSGLLANPAGRLVGTLSVTVRGATGPGTYPLNTDGSGSSWGQIVLTSRENLWSTDGAHLGTLEIASLDASRHRATGTFRFDGVNPVDGSVRVLRDGTFDAELQ